MTKIPHRSRGHIKGPEKLLETWLILKSPFGGRKVDSRKNLFLVLQVKFNHVKWAWKTIIKFD